MSCHLGANLPLPSSHLKNAMAIAVTNHRSPLSQLMQADPHKLDFRNELLARLPGAGGLGPLGGGLPSAHDLNRPASLFTAAGGCFCVLARYIWRKGAAIVCTIQRELWAVQKPQVKRKDSLTLQIVSQLFIVFIMDSGFITFDIWCEQSIMFFMKWDDIWRKPDQSMMSKVRKRSVASTLIKFSNKVTGPLPHIRHFD